MNTLLNGDRARRASEIDLEISELFEKINTLRGEAAALRRESLGELAAKQGFAVNDLCIRTGPCRHDEHCYKIVSFTHVKGEIKAVIRSHPEARFTSEITAFLRRLEKVTEEEYKQLQLQREERREAAWGSN